MASEKFYIIKWGKTWIFGTTYRNILTDAHLSILLEKKAIHRYAAQESKHFRNRPGCSAEDRAGVFEGNAGQIGADQGQVNRVATDIIEVYIEA
jgi:hypothetical protein